MCAENSNPEINFKKETHIMLKQGGDDEKPWTARSHDRLAYFFEDGEKIRACLAIGVKLLMMMKMKKKLGYVWRWENQFFLKISLEV